MHFLTIYILFQYNCKVLSSKGLRTINVFLLDNSFFCISDCPLEPSFSLNLHDFDWLLFSYLHLVFDVLQPFISLLLLLINYGSSSSFPAHFSLNLFEQLHIYCKLKISFLKVWFVPGTVGYKIANWQLCRLMRDRLVSNCFPHH